jgi:membrane-associated HD superfamily phosphohydrolase
MKIKIPYKYLLLIATLLYFNIIFLPPLGRRHFNFKEGEIATEDIIAPYDFSIPKTDDELLEERNAIVQRLPPVYDYDPGVLRNLESTIGSLEKM